jgi:hypothetical protein
MKLYWHYSSTYFMVKKQLSFRMGLHSYSSSCPSTDTNMNINMIEIK